MDNILNQIKWNEAGLVPVIIQDNFSKQVLMMAWMNKQSFVKSLELGQAVYYSRSRNKLWHKGEESGHFQIIHSIKLDCDGDCLLINVSQQGGISCHTGRHDCFFYTLENKMWKINQGIIKK